MSIDKDALTKLIKARTGLLIDQPFFGALAMRLQLVENPKVKTLNVNGKIVNYNPKFINTLSNDLAKSAMAHEVMHCVLQHCGSEARGKQLKQLKWNRACDYVVNDILKQAGFKLGEGWLWDAQYVGMSADHVYKLLPDDPDDGQGQGPGQSGSTGAGGQPSAGGGGSGGQPGPLDEVLPGDPDPAIQAQDDADWKLATSQAANAAKAAGKLSSGLDQFIEKLQKNKVDWRAELRNFLVRSAKNDYAWQRPNRKMLAAGFVLPGMYSEEMGSIVIASDESGSVDDAISAAFAAEINAIKEDMRPEKLYLQHFDTEVRKVEEFGPDDPFEMRRYANGGTSFVTPIRAAEDMAQKPLCMVVLTDLYGPFPKNPPDFPVLWVCINDQVAPFGVTIPIEV